MARQTQVILTDDLDGGDASETVQFALDGTSYEIDLSAKNAGKLRSNLEKYIEGARRIGRGNAATLSGRRRGRRGRSDGSVADPKAVRAWAISNGIEVNSRGRIPDSVVEQFRASAN